MKRSCTVAAFILLSVFSPLAIGYQEKADAPVVTHTLRGKGWYLSQINAQNSSTATLCRTNEIPVFACDLENGKVVSICASSDISKDTGYLKYRYGKSLSHVELTYPSGNARPQMCFKEDHAVGGLGSASAISFWVEKYRYSVFLTRATGVNQVIAGVIVDRDGRLVAFNQCREKSIALFFGPGLPLDLMGFDDIGIPPAQGDISYVSLEEALVAGWKNGDKVPIGPMDDSEPHGNRGCFK